MDRLLAALKERWMPPNQHIGPFVGKTVLITGTNTGLGFEAAKQVAALNAKILIITTRTQSKGEAAKEQIIQWLLDSKANSKTEIVPLVLDMSTAEGVKSFVKQLKLTTNTLDSVLLNAGINQPQNRISPDGFEEVLQVNTISTILLATLLLPLLTATADSKRVQTNLTFVSSRVATQNIAMPAQSIQNSTTPLMDLNKPENFPTQAMPGQVRYGQSKLFLEYAMRHMLQLPSLKDTDGKTKVIINSVCPGACSTDIARSYEGVLIKAFLYIVMPLVLKSAATGAQAELVALTADEKSSGKMWAVTDYIEDWNWTSSPEGKALGDKVWRDLQDLMVKSDPTVKDVLQAA